MQPPLPDVFALPGYLLPPKLMSCFIPRTNRPADLTPISGDDASACFLRGDGRHYGFVRLATILIRRQARLWRHARHKRAAGRPFMTSGRSRPKFENNS